MDPQRFSCFFISCRDTSVPRCHLLLHYMYHISGARRQKGTLLKSLHFDHAVIPDCETELHCTYEDLHLCIFLRLIKMEEMQRDCTVTRLLAHHMAWEYVDFSVLIAVTASRNSQSICLNSPSCQQPCWRQARRADKGLQGWSNPSVGRWERRYPSLLLHLVLHYQKYWITRLFR